MALASVGNARMKTMVAVMKTMATLERSLRCHMKLLMVRYIDEMDASFAMNIVRNNWKVTGLSSMQIVRYRANSRHDTTANSSCPPRPTPYQPSALNLTHCIPGPTYNIPYNINRLCLRKRQGPSPQRNLEKPRRRPHAVRARIQPKCAVRLARHSV
jgi:hypothetical protein